MEYLTLIKDNKKRNVATDIQGLSDNCAYVFNFYFNGDKNFVTPYIIKYYTKQKNNNFLFVELSTGKFMDSKIYGVTILKGTLKGNKLCLERCIDKDKPFNSKTEALTYIESLKIN